MQDIQNGSTSLSPLRRLLIQWMLTLTKGIMFDYLVTQNSNKHLWIKKATGLGVSEFMLRFMAWLCLKDDALAGSQMCIVTGPRIDLAIVLIDRMKKLFVIGSISSKSKVLVTFDSKETVVDLNGVKIEAFLHITWMQCMVYPTYLSYY
jgi:late competence protein required for DNA uptake (superfamily II DNA/RNA helicase)